MTVCSLKSAPVLSYNRGESCSRESITAHGISTRSRADAGVNVVGVSDINKHVVVDKTAIVVA